MEFIRMQKNKVYHLILFSLAVYLFFAACSDPLSEKDKETLVRTLIEGSIDPGRYIIFWNGKNDNKNLVNAGTYICKFWVQEYGSEIEMTALAVDFHRPARSNDSTYIDYHNIPLHFFLDENSPEPFYVNEGTNIIFDVPYRAEVLLTIHRKK